MDKASLVVKAADEDGSDQGTYDFSKLQAPSPLREELARAFARSVGPIGPWRRRPTCTVGFLTLRHFARFLGEVETPPTSLAQITIGMWNGWRLNGSTESNRAAEPMRVRVVLRNAPEVTATVRAAIEKRIMSPATESQPAFSVAELKRLRRAANHTVIAAARRIGSNYATALQVEPDERARILSHILTTGDLPETCRIESGALAGLAKRVLGVENVTEALELLYPSARETAAMGILLACDRGWNRSVIDQMTVPVSRADAQDGIEPPVYVADYEKPRAGRAGRHGTVTLASGAGAETLGLIIEVTGALRHTLASTGRETNRLLGYRTRRGPSGHHFRIGLPTHECSVEWAEEANLIDDEGKPLNPSFRRIRKTLQVIDRQPRQNSRAVHNRVYVMNDPTVRAEAAGIVTTGQKYAIQMAEATLGARIMGPDLLDLITTDIEAASRQTGLSAEVLRDLAQGERDTPTAGCIDMRNGPWERPGELCSASFLLCLACRNGVVTARHVPRLVHLRDSVASLGGTMDQDVWAREWADHYARLSDALDRVATPEEQGVARSALTDGDRTLVDALLRGGLDA